MTVSHLKELTHQRVSWVVRNLWYERPSESFRRRIRENTASPEFLERIGRLLKDGILILPAYFSGDKLKALKSEFERFAVQRPVSPKDEISISREVLRESEILSASAIHGYLIRLAAYYWGKPVYLAEWSGRRLFPREPERYASYQYHHDCKNKQIKAMVLLTDVTSSGQRMDYIPGTHNMSHFFNDYGESRFTEEQAFAFGEPVKCTGPAGTVIVFDTNGLHSGNRNRGSIRDTISANYTAGHARFLTDELHAASLENLDAFEKRILKTGTPRGVRLLRNLACY